jgi:nucleotide-binding universal stress UspA family protein
MITTSDSPESTAPIVRTVLHPSDFSDASLVAFAHALKAALISKGKLVLIHVSDEDQREWTDFPRVRETLARWKLLPAGSASSAVGELGINVTKVIRRGSHSERVLRHASYPLLAIPEWSHVSTIIS